MSEIQKETFINSLSMGYTVEEFTQLEISLIQSLHWIMNLVTPSDYLDELQESFVIQRSRLEDYITYLMIGMMLIYIF